MLVAVYAIRWKMSLYVVRYTKGANVRREADMRSALVMKLAKGTAVKVLSEAEVPGGDGKLIVRVRLGEPCAGWVSLKTLGKTLDVRLKLAKLEAKIEDTKRSFQVDIVSPRSDLASRATILVENSLGLRTFQPLDKEGERVKDHLVFHEFNSPRSASSRAPRDIFRMQGNALVMHSEAIGQIQSTLESSIAKLRYP